MLPGLIRNRLYTFRWVTLAVWLYFIEGVVQPTATQHEVVPSPPVVDSLQPRRTVAAASHGP